MPKFRTAQEFYDFCEFREACKAGLRSIKGKTAAEWWETTENGDWMMWLHDFGVWRLTNEQLAEYQRAMAALRYEYWRGINLATRIAADNHRRRLKYERAHADAIREIAGNPFKEASHVRRRYLLLWLNAMRWLRRLRALRRASTGR